MNKNYKLINDLKLSESIIAYVEHTPWVDMVYTTVFDRQHVINKYLKIHPAEYLDFARVYGFLMQKIGSLVSTKLPFDMESEVRKELADFFDKTTAESAKIRLQVLFSGSIFPLHIDQLTHASIVYPVMHETETHTNFYQHDNYDKLPRGIINPAGCKLIDSVQIKNVPVLLNVDKIHSVTYEAGTLLTCRPRLSITIKWETPNIYNLLAGER
jgi:hypothetical protein